MLGAQRMPGWTALFLATTVLTSVTGFMFPAVTVTPAAIFGAISLAVLALALLALYVFHANGAWRWIYVVTALLALYLNVFVLVVQAFQKIAVLHPLAPTGSEPPFLVAQTIVLLTFLWLGFGAVRKFHPEADGSGATLSRASGRCNPTCRRRASSEIRSAAAPVPRLRRRRASQGVAARLIRLSGRGKPLLAAGGIVLGVGLGLRRLHARLLGFRIGASRKREAQQNRGGESDAGPHGRPFNTPLRS